MPLLDVVYFPMLTSGTGSFDDCLLPTLVSHLEGVRGARRSQTAKSVLEVSAGERHTVFVCGGLPDHAHRLLFAGPRNAFDVGVSLTEVYPSHH